MPVLCSNYESPMLEATEKLLANYPEQMLMDYRTELFDSPLGFESAR
eukprot:CAMPEP_0203755046 /NCGR_PEP_ID=MMETSP0098-20131031/8569_1 /ASSEMBLY_ACC=CAM_ASM_000208 /TAXON_ID=96639 /ORGANISM=" , Strain NY0313808BC1" /LENGTH=46 /DNA_ID= /DNA_START= /DNA_END= /DNA_ORIENTATION=